MHITLLGHTYTCILYQKLYKMYPLLDGVELSAKSTIRKLCLNAVGACVFTYRACIHVQLYTDTHIQVEPRFMLVLCS